MSKILASVTSIVAMVSLAGASAAMAQPIRYQMPLVVGDDASTTYTYVCRATPPRTLVGQLARASMAERRVIARQAGCPLDEVDHTYEDGHAPKVVASVASVCAGGTTLGEEYLERGVQVVRDCVIEAHEAILEHRGRRFTVITVSDDFVP